MTRAGLTDPDDRDRDYVEWLQRDLRLHLVPDAHPDPDPVGWQPLPPELVARMPSSTAVTTDHRPPDDPERVDGEPDWDRHRADCDQPSDRDNPVDGWPVLPPAAAARLAEHLRHYPRR